MIIWINGAFGSGKTQTAFELQRRIPDSYVYDPENIGYFIRKTIPKSVSKQDFQDYIMWREFNYSMLKYIEKEYKGVILVPMTLVSPEYFREIVGRLRDDGVTVKHFTLSASKKVILKRLRSRREGANSWAAKQIDRCVKGLMNDIFESHIDTDDMTIEEVAERIAVLSDIHLSPDNRSSMRKRLDRLVTQIKHIHLLHL